MPNINFVSQLIFFLKVNNLNIKTSECFWEEEFQRFYNHLVTENFVWIIFSAKDMSLVRVY